MPADRPQARDAPDLVVLPPVIPLAALALAILLEWLVPLGYLPPPLAPVTLVIGLLLVLGFLGTGLWGAMEFRRARTNIDPRKPALVLVETGPYRFTRNPMYVGFLLLFAGIGLLASLDWSLPLLPLVWLALNRWVVLREEAYLSAKFGPPYDALRARTRRWL
jgi:protein-S-isoprenylcysteine O-methyltransferase Ste14